MVAGASTGISIQSQLKLNTRTIAECCQTCNPPFNKDNLKKGEFLSPVTPNKEAPPQNYVIYKKVPDTLKLYELTELYQRSTKAVHNDPTGDIEHHNKHDVLVIKLKQNGTIILYPSFIWNGPTGFYPFDWFMRPSLVHDALYVLMKKYPEVLPKKKYKPIADELLEKMLIEEGCSETFASAVHTIVKNGSWIAELFYP